MTQGSIPAERTVVSGTAVAAVISTLLAMPIMLFWILLFAFGGEPIGFDGFKVMKMLVLLPFFLPVIISAALAMWPLSLIAAALLTFVSARTLSRRTLDEREKSSALWLTAGAVVGLLVASAMQLENDMRLLASNSLLLAGTLTGMPMLLICRRLTRRLVT